MIILYVFCRWTTEWVDHPWSLARYFWGGIWVSEPQSDCYLVVSTRMDPGPKEDSWPLKKTSLLSLKRTPLPKNLKTPSSKHNSLSLVQKTQAGQKTLLSRKNSATPKYLSRVSRICCIESVHNKVFGTTRKDTIKMFSLHLYYIVGIKFFHSDYDEEKSRERVCGKKMAWDRTKMAHSQRAKWVKWAYRRTEPLFHFLCSSNLSSEDSSQRLSVDCLLACDFFCIFFCIISFCTYYFCISLYYNWYRRLSLICYLVNCFDKIFNN